MGTYIVRRLLSGIVLVFALTIMTFSISKLVPPSEDPACFLVPCTPGAVVSPAQFKAARHKLGVDRPVYVQYAKFLWRLLRHGSFGASFGGGSIDQALQTALPQTGSIMLGGMLLLLLVAIPLGVLSAMRANTFSDRLVLFASIFGIALHPFVIGFVLRRVFGGWLHLLPTSSYCPLTTHGFPSSASIGPFDPFHPPKLCGGFADWADHLILPSLTFAIFFLPLYTRIIRTRVLETLGEPHVAAARAKGASELRLLRRHVLRLSLLPVIPMIAMDLGGALMAAIYVEVVFSFSGIGRLVLQLLEGNPLGLFDIPLIAGVFFVVGAAIVLSNLIADLVHYFLEPRVRLSAVA
jgi:peptide/nickel transport system permease protein